MGPQAGSAPSACVSRQGTFPLRALRAVKEKSWVPKHSPFRLWRAGYLTEEGRTQRSLGAGGGGRLPPPLALPGLGLLPHPCPPPPAPAPLTSVGKADVTAVQDETASTWAWRRGSGWQESSRWGPGARRNPSWERIPCHGALMWARQAVGSLGPCSSSSPPPA